MKREVRNLVLGIFAVALASVYAGAQATVKLVTERPSYNVGSEVYVEVIRAALGGHLTASIRYAGDSKPVAARIPLRLSAATAAKRALPSRYVALWRIPATARAGRYEIDVDGPGGENTAAFVVYRKLVRIERLDLDKTFYTSGDPVRCRVMLRSLTAKPLTHLRVEFSDRYWPWIAGPADQAKASIVALSRDLSLAPGRAREIHSERAGVAAAVTQPTVHQYGVVVWDRGRKNVLDIAFSQLAFIRPPGSSVTDSPHVYPGQYPYPSLDAIHFDAYRHFYPPEPFDSRIVQFDRSHTMFPVASSGEVEFTVRNPTSNPWLGALIGATVWANGTNVAEVKQDETVDVYLTQPPLKRSTRFKLPDIAGLDSVDVHVADARGRNLAWSELQIAANPLPKSIMIFCAHEDDEGGWGGLIRAVVENDIPIHFVYFTSGDAGSCDRYYQHSCDPAEALNFGSIRMDETRAVLGHLGVPRSDIYFLGLPDGGSGKIWYDHVAETNPYVSVLLASDHAPYDGLYRPNLVYARDAVVEAVAEIIQKFQPEVIVTAHPPADSHIDHIVNNYFVVKALQGLLRRNAIRPETRVYVDRIYDAKTHPATPYHYATRDFYVSGEAAALAQEAGWFYESQGATSAEGYLRDFDKLPRLQPYREVLDWKEHEGWNEKLP